MEVVYTYNVCDGERLRQLALISPSCSRRRPCQDYVEEDVTLTTSLFAGVLQAHTAVALDARDELSLGRACPVQPPAARAWCPQGRPWRKRTGPRQKHVHYGPRRGLRPSAPAMPLVSVELSLKLV